MTSRGNVSEWFTQGLQLHRSGQLTDAEQMYRRVLERDRRHADAAHYLGLLVAQSGRREEAIQWARRSLMLAPERSHYYSNFAEMLRRLGEIDAAIAVAHDGVQRNPRDATAYTTLAAALSAARRCDEAIDALRRALEIRPDSTDAYIGMGCLYRQIGQWAESLQAFENGSRRAPTTSALLGHWADALFLAGRISDALDKARHAVQLGPDDAVAHASLARCLAIALQPSEAIQHFRRAVEIRPDFAVAHSDLLFELIHHSGISHEQLLAEHIAWGRRHAPSREPSSHNPDRDPDRPLRIGYLSADFRQHAVSYFLEPILAHHSSACEVFCYISSPSASEDATTGRLMGLVPHWRVIAPLSDSAAAALVRDQDRIDILVDLSGHSANHRLQMLALRPAPIQATYLGYQATTGVPAIDYRITDAIVDPPGESDAHYTETLVRLELFACYRPPDEAPPIEPPPSLSGQPFTFGAFTKVNKISDRTFDLWASVLRRVEKARMLVFAAALGEPFVQQRLRDRFESRGVDPSRIEPVGPQLLPDYLRSHARVDLALDSIPFNGHTTTCHALWMGVPTVTLAGNRYASRMGLSVLSVVGLEELVAASPEQFAEVAESMSKNLGQLAEWRSTMRARMQQSRLMDGRRFTERLEAEYRRLWRVYCAK